MTSTYRIMTASLVFVSVAAAAEPPQRASVASSPITVQAGERSLEAWSKDVSKSLTDHMVYPRSLGTANLDEGVVRVRFHCTAQGQPDGLALVQSSRHAAIDRAALYAVGHINALSPLPAGITPDRPMEAWLVFATDEQNGDRMMNDLRKQRQAQLARASGNGANALLAASTAPIIFMSR